MRHTRTVVAIGLAVMVFWAGRAGSVLAQQAPQVQSITLEEALATALRRNLTLRVAAFEVRVAETQLVQATAAKSGQINATAAYSRTRQQDPMVVPVSPGPGSVTLPTPDVNQYQAGVALQLPLYTGGRLESQAALAEANLRGAQAALERIRQQIVLEVKQAYYRLLLARAGERAAERVLARAQENHRLARARVEAGTVPRFDALQAETSVASADLGVVRVQNDVALARQSLAALLYLPLTTPLEPKEELTFALAPRDLTVDSLIARALQARPELAELRAQTAVATAAVAVARSGLLPHLFLTAMYGGMGGPSFTETWSAGLMVTLLVFDGGVTQARIREAEARL
ncbi:MAG: TolC family protein, partial [Armatimonadetes bacterium]|nr:TolC family protein [Armatimonadota bacterium]